MNILSLIAVGILALMLTAFLVLLPVAIIFNMKAGMKYRQNLARGVEKLRLSKMLTALGIDVNEYLANNPALEIRSHMERCSECSNTEECDDQLSNSAIDADRIGFCNNEESLREIVNNPRQ